MNRSILIVICDFLLVSLLAFSTVDINKTTNEGVPRQVKTTIATNQNESRQDLAAVMRLALEQERKGRELLVGELARTREAVSQQQAQLSEREKQVQTFRQELQQKEQQTTQLEQQQMNLLQQFAAAQTNVQNLSQQLLSSSAEAQVSKERLADVQAEYRRQAEQAAALQQQLGQLAQSNQLVLAEKQRLAGQLQVAEAEKRLVAQQAARMQEEVKVERAEKAKLAEGVQALASKSDQLAREIKQNRPLAPNTIFDQFVTNRVEVSFWAVRSGFLGLESNKRAEAQSVLVTDGAHTVALCHVQDTPLNLGHPGADWQGITGTLDRSTASIPIRSLSFYAMDPRIVFVPVTPAEAGELGCRVYRLASDPYNFQDAVVVGSQESHYGQCSFQLDVTTPLYLKMDHNTLKGLFGKFNPSRGDLVFSRTGELLGVMANNTYCVMIKDFKSAATLRLAQDMSRQPTAETLSRLHSLIAELPSRLQ
jgi:hypothetical protein